MDEIEAVGLKYFDDWQDAVNDLCSQLGMPPKFQVNLPAASLATGPQAKKQRTSNEASGIRVRAVDASGDEVGDARLLDHGFEVNQTVQRKSDKIQATVIKLGQEVELQLLETGKKYKIAQLGFIAEWKPCTMKPAAELVDCSDAKLQLEKAYVKAKVQVAIHDMPSCWDDLELQVKPQKKCVSKVVFQKGKLVLAPVTWKVEVTKDEMKGHGVKAIGSTDHGDVHLFQPGNVATPFWFLTTSGDKAECNMEPKI